MCRGNEREIEQYERQLNVIARIEAEYAMSYLLGSALVTFLFYVLIFHLWRSCWMLGGRKLRDCKARQSQIEDAFGNPCSIQVRDGSRWKRWRVKLIGHV